jgi:hypothetical protein
LFEQFLSCIYVGRLDCFSGSYTFLDSIITRDGYDYKDISRRLSIGRMAMTKLEKIMKDWDIKKATKIKIAETIIFPTVTYGSESWQ